ncbi:hypothetical protein [uncultured Psychroserpens sp.]|uniref:hypothetical protein n=1 Tax=uncultured Psychroserpens sp. TaxID=255436 RepID=UPI00263931EB|nr:hypothetical protein [uncultured Psychroserpens sp.]
MNNSRAQLLSEIKPYKSLLVGKKLKNVFFTHQGEGTVHLEGLGSAYYFSTILETEDKKKYCFGNDWITKWDANEHLYEVTHENWRIPRNIKYRNIAIIDILIDDDDEIYIRLENDVLIYHTMDYGDKLFFDEYSTLFDKNGKLLNEE